MSIGIPGNQAAALSQTASMSSTTSAASAADLGIESQDFKTAPGVELDQHKSVLVGSVLDLFAGKPSLKKLQLWADDAKFSDPLAKAEGRKQFEAQWYGLKAAFSEIVRLSLPNYVPFPSSPPSHSPNNSYTNTSNSGTTPRRSQRRRKPHLPRPEDKI